VKLVAKVDRTRLLVVIEEVGDGGIQGVGGLIIIGHGKGQDRIIDRGVKPALHRSSPTRDRRDEPEPYSRGREGAQTSRAWP
jgi:hypothetical protein